jgi:hypothetical protein
VSLDPSGQRAAARPAGRDAGCRGTGPVPVDGWPFVCHPEPSMCTHGVLNDPDPTFPGAGGSTSDRSMPTPSHRPFSQPSTRAAHN